LNKLPGSQPLRKNPTNYYAEFVPGDLHRLPDSSRQLQAHNLARNRALTSFRLSGDNIKLTLVSTAAIFLAVLLLMISFLSAIPQKASVSVSEVLNALAKVAADQPANLTGTVNSYRYLKSEGANLVIFQGRNNQKFAVLVPKTREFWVAPDGSGRIRETASGPVFLGERDWSNWQASGSPSPSSTINEDFEPGGLSYQEFSRFPTDPNALATVIRSQADIQSGPPVNVEMFIIVGDLLREPGAPPEVRSALYKVAGKIDGVELVGNITDRIGRQGVAVAITSNYSGAKQRLILIFDPTTAKLLGEEKVLLEHTDWIDAKPPVVIGYTTYLESGIVTKLP
jgi:hypothetical protein